MSQLLDVTCDAMNRSVLLPMIKESVFSSFSSNSSSSASPALLFDNEIVRAFTTPLISSPTVATAALAGVAAHLGIFMHGEWHVRAPDLFTGSLVVVPALVGLFVRIGGHDLSRSLSESFSIVAAFLAGLFISMAIYRRFFHRLRHFDGPFWAGITKIWHALKVLDSKNYLVLEDLRQKHGDFVRTGPNEITCFLPDVVAAIDGHGSPCDKAVWYDILLPDVAVNTTRDRATHDARRRIWNKGFTADAMDEYQRRVHEYAALLERHVERAVSRSSRTDEGTGDGDADEIGVVNATDLFSWFTFDVMGEFAFGKSFGMLADGRWHFAVTLLQTAMRILGPTTPVPWLAQIGLRRFVWTRAARDWHAMMAWCRDQLRARITDGTNRRRDIAHYLIQASEEGGTVQQDLPWLQGDTVTVIVAGSDTTSTTLLYSFFELARDPERVRKLREEIDGVDIYSPKDLETCEYLNGVVNEALRLYPPLPSHGYRQTPPEGITVAGTYIPGGVTVVAPRYSLGRLESCYEDPLAFLPERWSSRPELVKDRRGFRPFGEGRYGCVGKTLALREIRFVVALLLRRYDVRLAPGEDGARLEADKRDYLTAAPGTLKLAFAERADAEAAAAAAAV